MNYCYYQSPLGRITMTGNGQAITGLALPGQSVSLSISTALTDVNSGIFAVAGKWLDVYFKGRDPGELPPLSFSGTPFRMMVWEILKDVPYGRLTTYGEIAREVEVKRGMEKMSAQAIGGAVGHNPISIFIPCHRVLGANSRLVGYGGGLDLKIALLKLEGFDVTRFSEL